MILVSEEYTPSSIARLKTELKDQNIQTFDPRNSLSNEQLENVTGLLIRSSFSVDKKWLEQTAQLKWVVTSTSGFDHIDLAECRSRDIQVSYTPDANVESVVELTTYFALQGARRFYAFESRLKKHKWKSELPKSNNLSGNTFGIIGLGRIGARVAQMMKQFGMNVVAHDPYVEPEIFRWAGVESVGMSEVFRMSDYLSLHVPLTDETRDLINEKTLEMMSDESFLINTSRGQVVQEVALIEALRSGQIRGAALDVFRSEPLPGDSPFREMESVILTPHLGAYVEGAFSQASELAVSQTIAYFLGKGSNIAVSPSDAPWFK